MEFDFVIVGAGSAGCVLANRLSADGKSTVCLLEAGGEDRNFWIKVPAGYIKTMVNPSINWMFESTMQDGHGTRVIPVPRGKVMGGSSSINSMLYVRGQARDYDIWGQLGCTGWSYSDILPYFKRMEHCEMGADELRGTGGPVNVAMPTERYGVLDRLIEAAGELGFPMNNDYNGASQEGLSYYQVTQKNGRRVSAKSSHIDPIRASRPNLHIEIRAFAKKVLIENNRAIGVEYEKQGRTITVRARKEVILSAGAVQSPQLLELSGVGQGERLQRLGIEVIRDLRGVGENLQDHFISRLAWKMKGVESLNQMTRGIPLAIEVAKFFLLNRGALTMPAGIIAGFVKSRPELETPDIQYHIAHATFKDPGKRVFDRFPGLTIGPSQLRPESRGYIHAVTPNFKDAPEIQFNFLSSPVDVETHIAGARIARKLMATETMKPFVVEEVVPGPAAATDDEIIEYARSTGATIYHPSCTCKMGKDAMAVVDPELRVKGIQGLRVADTSVMPRLISGNTNAATMMIGEKAADMILAANR